MRNPSNRINVIFAAVLLAILTACKKQPPEAAKPATTAQNFSSDELVQRTLQRRAVEAVIWGTPAVNFDRMYQAMVHDANAGEGSNKVVFWSRFRVDLRVF